MNVIVSNKYQDLLASLDIDVIKNLNGVFSVDELISQFSNFYFNKMIIDISALQNYEDISTLQTLSVNLDPNKLIILLDDSPTVNSQLYLSQMVSIGIYNFTKKVDSISYLINNPNSYKDVANFQNLDGKFNEVKLNDTAKNYTEGSIGRRVVGIKNITEHAGATTLTYLMKMHLEKYYKVKAVELDKHDFVYFNEKDLDSVTSNSFDNYLNQNQDAEIILVDLNNISVKCDEIINLIEPGLIQLNKLIRRDSSIFEKLRNQKIILNRSVLSENEVNDFEKESGSKVYFNMPNVDDKLNNQMIVNQLLVSLGFTRVNESEDKGIFGIL